MTTDMITGQVKQYPYRTARVGDIFISVPRDTVKLLEYQLAEAAGVRVDNHTVYEIIQHGRSAYIMFSDFHATFGQSVDVSRW